MAFLIHRNLSMTKSGVDGGEKERGRRGVQFGSCRVERAGTGLQEGLPAGGQETGTTASAGRG